MPASHIVATLTSRGRVTVPKVARQALGVEGGGKIAFEVRGGEVVIARAAAGGHEELSSGEFLDLLEADIRMGRNVLGIQRGAGDVGHRGPRQELGRGQRRHRRVSMRRHGWTLLFIKVY